MRREAFEKENRDVDTLDEVLRKCSNLKRVEVGGGFIRVEDDDDDAYDGNQRSDSRFWSRRTAERRTDSRPLRSFLWAVARVQAAWSLSIPSFKTAVIEEIIIVPDFLGDDAYNAGPPQQRAPLDFGSIEADIVSAQHLFSDI